MIRQLRKAKDLRLLMIHAVDGEIGKPEEFYFDDGTWSVRYLVINTGSWLLGRRVLIAPLVVIDIDDSTNAIKISLTQEQVRNSPPVGTKKPISRQYEEVRVNLERRVIQSAPEYNPSDIISRDYELKLFEHYSKHTENAARKA